MNFVYVAENGCAVLLSHESIHGGGKLCLQYSYNIICISELILISWNFMRLCYLWADAAPAPNRLNSSSCGLHHLNPKSRWSGFHGWLASLYMQVTRIHPILWPCWLRSCPILSMNTGLCITLLTSLAIFVNEMRAVCVCVWLSGAAEKVWL